MESACSCARVTRAFSIWFFSGVERACRLYAQTYDSGRRAATVPWRSICRIAAAGEASEASHGRSKTSVRIAAGTHGGGANTLCPLPIVLPGISSKTLPQHHRQCDRSRILLALALLFGRAAWGGAYRVLPPRHRTASALSALPLGLAAWIAFSILALNTVANFASRSRIERTLMTPAAFVCSVCFLVAALSDHP